MDAREADQVVRRALAAVAPDAVLDRAGPDDDLRYTLDLDSMDLLDLVATVHDATGVDIPEVDYAVVRTRRGFADYLAAATEAQEAIG